MRRILSVLFVLSILFGSVVFMQPTQTAEATTSWPISQDFPVNGVYAQDNGNLALMSCAGRTGSPQATLLDSDGNRLGTLNLQEQCLASFGETASSGVLYSYENRGNASFVSAWKNDRQLWEYEITSPTDCTYANGDTYQTRLLSPSIGSDGNLYGIVSGGFNPSSCSDRLIGLDVATGSEIFTPITLTAGPSGGYWFEPRAWTYAASIVIVDRDGLMRTFSYSGVENTGLQYQFDAGTGRTIRTLAANENGTVFAATAKTSGSTSEPAVLFRKSDGTTGTIANTQSNDAAVHLLPIDDDRVASLNYASKVDILDANLGTATSFSLPNTSGFYWMTVLGYIEDQDGNAVIIRKYSDYWGANGAIGVDVWDASSQTVTNAFYGTNPSGTPDWSVFGNSESFSHSIANGNLYLSICKDGANCGNSYPNPTPTSWIHKIALAGFGSPITSASSQNDYVDTRLEYVAMGDSFSSGEGADVFNAWTDQDGINQCHRSHASYANMLADPSRNLNINLVDHVACSGATTNDILGVAEDEDPHGKWVEPTQLDALNSETDIVTISIGGNDVFFGAYAEQCWFFNCGYSDVSYINTMSAITSTAFEDRLTMVYSSILSEAPNADVYVLGYPYITPLDASANLSCLPFQDSTPESSVNDSNAARSVVLGLNATIKNVVEELEVTENRIHFVDAASQYSPFEGHDVCSTSSYFVHPNSPGAGLTENHKWFHPNTEGQDAYADLIANAMNQ